ncbi:MAG: class I SAM-dependent methyltransferase [Alphaproteobacteria bacterium]|nr:class I SAM-dependent methyltransferase [Alphaproteobacteria bacterium]
MEAVLADWPAHGDTLAKSFADRSDATHAHVERTAELVLKLADLDDLVRGYRWMCDMVFEEELGFRRTGRYRHASFAEVDRLVYQDRAAMTAYMHGLLASEVLWVQHARSLEYFVERFLPGNREGYRHLEVGPGHGILFWYAASDPRCSALVGYDISPTSLDATRRCLETLGVDRPFALEARDITAPLGVSEPFDSIAISEVCEHLEDPVAALRSLRGILAPGGRMYVNVPINAPAIDHITLLETPEAAVEMVESAGFRVLDPLFAPPAGYDLARARKRKASVSVALTAVPA